MTANNVFVSVAQRKSPIGRKRKKKSRNISKEKGYVKAVILACTGCIFLFI